VTTRDEDVWDDARAEAFITELRRAWANGELLEEIPWTAEDEAASDAVWDELRAQWAREAEVAAAAKRRRELRRRRAWGVPASRNHLP
jgi:hypothetical protein